MGWRFLILLPLAGCTVSEPGNGTGFPVAMESTGAASDDGDDADTSPKTTGISADSGNDGDEGDTGSSSGGSDDDTSTGGSSSSSGDPNACDPVIPGEWNDCTTEMGTVDNTLCNWIPDTDANGWISCLNSSQSDGSSVCMITDCVDVCDCFAPPPTGTAEVACDAVLEGGGTACYLDCSAGSCPDGMECQNSICFWPAPE